MSKKMTGWRIALTLFFITSIVESFGMSQVFAFLPVLLQDLGVIHVAMWVGILTATTFIVGLPLVPLWGIWAERYSAKAIIIRSAYVEAVVFALLAYIHVFSGVFAAMALIGFQLGNTGIMLSSLRNLLPNHKVGYAVSILSISSPVGMALGPLLGGLLVGTTVTNLRGLFWSDALLSILTGSMLLLFYHEPPRVTSPEEIIRNSVWRSAWASVRVTFELRVTWLLFGIYTILMIGRQMVNPFLPIAIEQLHPLLGKPTIVIGVLMGFAAMVGALITIVAGKIGDRIGFTKVLAIAFALSVPSIILLAFVQKIYIFSIPLTGFSAATSISGAMIFALLSTRVPATHRSTALNLVYLPLYLGGIIGPAIASSLSSYGLIGPFLGSSAVFALGLFLMATLWWMQRKRIHRSNGIPGML